MAYRGDGEASAERLAALDEEIARLEARLTPVFWERVAAAWRVPRELSPALGPLEARHERIAAIEAGIERAKTGPFAEPELPELPPPSTGLLSAVEQALYVGEVYDGVRSAMRVHAPDAELEYRGHGVRGVRSSVDGAPIDLQVLLERGGDRSRMVLEGTTTVVPSARLGLKPEGILQDLLEMLGFSEEIELGDPILTLGYPKTSFFSGISLFVTNGVVTEPVVAYTPNVIPVGFVLDVTPQVGMDDVITLNVHPTVTDIER